MSLQSQPNPKSSFLCALSYCHLTVRILPRPSIRSLGTLLKFHSQSFKSPLVHTLPTSPRFRFVLLAWLKHSPGESPRSAQILPTQDLWQLTVAEKITPPAWWLTQMEPGTPKAFPDSVLSPFLVQLFHTLSPQTFHTSSPSLLLAANRASSFSGKIEAIKKEFPQAPETTASHLHASVLESPSSLLLLWMDHLLRGKVPRPTCTRSHPPYSSPEDSSPRSLLSENCSQLSLLCFGNPFCAYS